MPLFRFAAEKKAPAPAAPTTPAPKVSEGKRIFTTSVTPEEMSHLNIPLVDAMTKHYRKFHLE
jgi:hypothetical protein